MVEGVKGVEAREEAAMGVITCMRSGRALASALDGSFII